MKSLKLYTLLFLMSAGFVCLSQTSNENYVTTHTARIETTGSISSNTDHTQVTRSTQYFDGLGRPMQTVVRKGSPDGKDLVTPIEYDAFGRQSKSYLPYSNTPTTPGNYHGSWSSEIDNFYSAVGGEVADETDYFYSEQIYEPSPLNRVDKEFGPGTNWRTNNKPVDYTYRTNTTGDAIPMFDVNLSTYQIDYVDDSNYAAGELWVVQTADENGNRTLEFKDKLGQVVCKKAEYSTGNYTTTLYIYDDYGNLTFVVPPEAASQASSAWETNLNNTSFRAKWMFRYKYDERNRMIEKQVPGSAPMYMVYDKRDRLVLTQDGNQGSYEVITTAVTKDHYDGNSYQVSGSGSLTLTPGFEFSASSTNSFHISSSGVPERTWTFTKYDALNRPVMTGIYTSTQTRSQLQTAADGISDFTEDYTGAGTYHGYDNSGYPTSIEEEDILTVTYYDDYDFTGETEPSGALTTIKGQVTGTKTKVLGTNTYLTGITWYDDKYRVIKTKMDNHLGGYDIHVLAYFNKVRPVVKKDTHTHNDGSSNTTIVQEYFYDHMDRLTKTTHKVNSQSTVTLHENDYNEIGELIEKDLGGSSSPVQSVDYLYNIRGWLTSINDANVNGTISYDDGSDKFGMELLYESAIGSHATYNGNIGHVNWQHSGQYVSRYSYLYDRLNRITIANSETSGDDEYFNLDNVSYDLNGNILTLNRTNNGTYVDILDYDYANGNQLSSVDDISDNSLLFDDSGSSGHNSNEYLYDMNGNMIRDANKGISSISYNFLNLPEKVNLPNGDYVKYTYDAAGVKLSKETTQGSDLDYVGPVHYKDGAIEFIQTSEGRAVKNGSTYNYEYNLTDHLGNVRATVDASTGNVIQRDDYYPFGLTFNSYSSSPKNNYLYNQGFGEKTFQGEEGKIFGVERQPELGVDFTKYRVYDPALGRFWNIDPAAEMFGQESWTPYHYSFNNPIRWNDPFGNYPPGGINQGGQDPNSGKTKMQQERREEFNKGVKEVVNSVKSFLSAADDFVTGSEPDTRGQEQSNRGGEELYKTEGSSGSPSTVGKPDKGNDITTLTNAKGVGPAGTSTPGSTAEIVKDVAGAVDQVINLAQSPSENKPVPGTRLGGSFNFSDSTGTTRVIGPDGDTLTIELSKEDIFGN